MLSKLLSTETADLAAKSLDRLAELILRSVDALKSQVKGRESAVGLAAAAVGLHLYYWYKLTFWSRRGIKSAPAIPFLGSYYAFLLKPRVLVERNWASKYGKFYGYYMGTQPMIACNDLDVINQICIKDFSKFRNHAQFGIPNRFEKNFLFLMKDEEWHTTRSILSPTFSSGKMKIMFKLVDRCADDLVEAHRNKIKGKKGEEIALDPVEVLREFGVSASLNSFFSMSLEQQSKPDKAKALKDTLVDRSKQIIGISLLRIVTTLALPTRLLTAIGFSTNSAATLEFYDKTTRTIMEARRKSGKKYNDYLQMLLDLDSSQAVDRTASELSELHHGSWEANELARDGSSNGSEEKVQLSSEQITVQILTFLAAGGEAVSQAVSNTILALAHHPDVQSRLYEEISALKLDRSKEGCTFDYEQLSSCAYLDAVVSETFRLAPLALVADRVAGEDFFVAKYGVTISKGTVVTMGLHLVMRDPDNWSDPESFDPSRFFPENKANIKPGSYCPFGIGPRFCLAFRFAIMEIKLALARLVLDFEFRPTVACPFPPPPSIRGILVAINKNLVIPTVRST